MFLNNDTTAAAPISDPITFQTYIYEEGNPPEFLDSEGAVPRSDWTIHGTMWQPQFWSHVNKGAYGWGSVMSNKNAAGGYEWVHISVPYPTYINDVPQYIKYIEFCAQADYPTRTKPTKIDLCERDTLICLNSDLLAKQHSKHLLGG